MKMYGILHSDFTFGRVADKQGAVIITATDDGNVVNVIKKKHPRR